MVLCCAFRFLLISHLLIIAFCTSKSENNIVKYDPDPAYVCSFCTIVLALVEEKSLQILLRDYMIAQCTSIYVPTSVCEYAVDIFIKKMEANISPDLICQEIKLCGAQYKDCVLYPVWPMTLPPQPIPWNVERKLDEAVVDISVLSPILMKFASVMPSKDNKNGLPMMAHVAYAIAGFITEIAEDTRNTSTDEYSPCGYNLTCHLVNLGNHIPLQDYDGDRYSSSLTAKFRGTDWRGVDCDDLSNTVYPGRMLNNGSDDSDHNCNGIFGSNDTATYEELFCSEEYAPRGLIMLGDSATAHFHIPPQWLTAQGWNLNGIFSIAADELDFPHCSWGTGHTTPDNCPYQYAVPGVTGVTSLYSQLRERNRCYHNDFQNIGVNGARMTSSMGLVDAMARDSSTDNPVLLWLSLIGNDVCSSHTNFDHMTPPDEFYSKALETLQALDALLPSGSAVVALALFQGEVLYEIMHKLQHPVGATYDNFYDYMNCLEENPCWGWLNTNETVRRLTTAHADSLNDVYRNISQTSSFKNFEFIFYSPQWSSIFKDYGSTGQPISNLVEPSDGFHPSQTGNALFAKEFFSFLNLNYPKVLGPVNPFNNEIDAMFFNQGTL